MKLGSFHLSYCTNVHPGESWNELFSNLHSYLLAVRDRLAPGERFAAGIWLPEPAISSLAETEQLDFFIDFLKRENLYVIGVNAFPYGNFHAPPVKESVYLPDWTDRRRVDYSNRTAGILSRILMETDAQQGNLSTVPGAFKKSITRADQVETMARHFLDHAARLFTLYQQTGRSISLAIEPEPCCFLETTDEVINFFRVHLISSSGRKYFREQTGVAESEAEAVILRHLGICFDVCHLAVQFEDPTESLDKLEAAGIRIDRIQLSSAVDIEIEGDLDDNLERLRPFNEHVYLHQVVESSRLGGSDTVLRRFHDLPEELQALSQEGGFLHPRKWRIHFHLPLFLSETDEWGTTQNQVIDILESLQHKPRCRHLEVETYTWNVLPPELQTEDRSEERRVGKECRSRRS